MGTTKWDMAAILQIAVATIPLWSEGQEYGGCVSQRHGAKLSGGAAAATTGRPAQQFSLLSPQLVCVALSRTF